MSHASSVDIQLRLEEARHLGGERLGELLQLYVNYLKVLASTQLDPKLRARVSPSDVIQETLLEAHRDFPQFRGTSEPELLAWLRRILIHNLGRLVEQHVLAAKRTVGREFSLERMQSNLEKSSLQIRSLLAADQSTPSVRMQEAEHARFLSDQLALLPDDYREIIILRNLEGLSFKEAADRMNRSHGAVRMLWLRAIELLRQKFAEAGML